MRREDLPRETRCQNCGAMAASVICNICKQPKPELLAVQRCRYFPQDECDCGHRGFCLTAA